MHTHHVALRYLIDKNNANPRLIIWVFMSKEFYFEVKDKRGQKNDSPLGTTRRRGNAEVEKWATLWWYFSKKIGIRWITRLHSMVQNIFQLMVNNVGPKDLPFQ